MIAYDFKAQSLQDLFSYKLIQKNISGYIRVEKRVGVMHECWNELKARF